MQTEIKSTQTARIRALNDELRKDFSQGHAVMTTGIAALGAEAVARIVKTIEVYDDFCHANDPYEEHDFGSFEADGHTIFFKIDYFDCTLTVHSPDPSDPTVTKRVIISCWPRSIEDSHDRPKPDSSSPLNSRLQIPVGPNQAFRELS